MAATSEKLTLLTKKGKVEFCFENPSVIRIKGEGVELRLKPIDKCYAVPMSATQWRFLNGQYNDFFYIATALKGASFFKPLDTSKPAPNRADDFYMRFFPDASYTFEAALEEFVSEWAPRNYTTPFEQCVARNKNNFDQWIKQSPPVIPSLDTARMIAEYQNWASLVAPRGLLKRETMLMSKNWMNTYYSWDHCFNAMALAPAQPDAAWAQLMGIFDHQSKIGGLPDCVDDEKEAWGILKTPVHGWALKQMMKVPGLVTLKRMQEIYPHLSQWTNFWVTYRDPDGNGLPQYNHSFESFDDTPPFDVGLPVEGPELATFLIIQMNVLETLANKIGKSAEGAVWKKRAAKLTETLIQHLWNGEKFISVNTVSGKHAEGSNSFISYVPLLLGNKLPAGIRQKLIADLKKEGGLLTRFGFATEGLSSPYFYTDSYTRGSIWAPVNHILIDGLEACNEHEFARQVAQRYCYHMVRLGFSERFDALTGELRSDPAYTWTSSVFLILAHIYFLKNAK